ncbi:unnamed protein product [Mytilus coruscus]|uniref:DDE Tnp4 domain-containing protein n=1 Tax=Mytilus coruscus TaxID=42192 RepID=A0A6J8E412_MYTCO|nr:unnamed protein product [Mytilus coruscus]
MVLLPPPPVPPFQSENDSYFFMILNILITYLRSIKMPLPFYNFSIRNRILEHEIVIDNQKNICYVHSGFLGHNNDAFCYQQIRQIGRGLENDFPAHCFILADSIYPNAPPLVTPFKSTDIVRRPRLEQKRKRKFNLLHRKRRVYVENVIKELKTFRVIGTLYRHPRWEMSSIVELCAALAKRRADLIKDVYS